jgi:hypothetical protein
MRARRLVSFTPALLGCFVSTAARAEHTSVQATVSGSVAVTDNVFAGQDRNPDAFTQVRPGALFAYDSPRMLHELDAELEVLEYAVNHDQLSLSLRSGWRGFFLPTPRSEVLVQANASNGKVNALTSRTAPDQTGFGVLPGGGADFIQADSSEYMSYQTGKDTRASQTLLGRYTYTDDGAGTTVSAGEVAATAGFDQNFRNNSFTLEGGVSAVRLERIAPAGAVDGSRLDRQVNPRGSLSWRRDFNRLWSGNIEGGLIYVNPILHDPYNPGAVRNPHLLPIAAIQAGYTDYWGRAIFSLRRTVTPNLFIAQNTVDESAIAQANMPLPWLDDNRRRQPKLIGIGSLGFERTSLIDPDSGMTNSSFYVVRLDVGVAWTPQPGQTYGLRYEFLRQSGNTTATALIPGYWRNTVFFTFSYRYPQRQAVVVPRNRQSIRADRKDLSPIGEEPVVPDAYEDQQQNEENNGP